MDITRAVNPVVDVFAPLFFVSIGTQVDVARWPARTRAPFLSARGPAVELR